ncbi:hypothetical protein ACOTVS_11140 [Aliarcobacter butzleri]|uniref:hypothetical protein n=1 Tax=Aliarcobacter butzleri TaxID=28197 RepID=UPI00345053C7
MVRILFAIMILVFLNGCSFKSNTEKENISTKVNKERITQEDERRLFYKGDYDINYKQPRVVWFKPMLTSTGNILSERTITLAPKDIKWTNEHNMNTGNKFKELIGEKK